MAVVSRARVVQRLKLPDNPLEGHDVLGRGTQRGSLGRRQHSGVHFWLSVDCARGLEARLYYHHLLPAVLMLLCYFAPSREPWYSRLLDMLWFVREVCALFVDLSFSRHEQAEAKEGRLGRQFATLLFAQTPSNSDAGKGDSSSR